VDIRKQVVKHICMPGVLGVAVCSLLTVRQKNRHNQGKRSVYIRLPTNVIFHKALLSY